MNSIRLTRRGRIVRALLLLAALIIVVVVVGTVLAHGATQGAAISDDVWRDAKAAAQWRMNH